MNKKLQTAGAGWASLVWIIGTVLNAYLDGDPQTMPDWAVLGPLLLTSLASIRSRPVNMSSEECGATPKPDPAPPAA